MKRANLLNLLVAGILLATGATGCKKQAKNITPIGSSGVRPGGGSELGSPITSRNGLTGASVTPGTGATGQPLYETGPGSPNLDANEDRDTLGQNTIYFDFDRSAIKPSEQPKLDQVATYLKNTPGVQLRAEGNCDERGTEEYNRALGERRALASFEYLMQKHGIESARITTVSYGEDKPVSLEKTEEGYAKNRRVDFVILKPR